jgi:hypothetical protein
MTLNFTILSLLLFLLEAPLIFFLWVQKEGAPLVFFSHIKMTYKQRWRIGFWFVAAMKVAAMAGKPPKRKKTCVGTCPQLKHKWI